MIGSAPVGELRERLPERCHALVGRRRAQYRAGRLASLPFVMFVKLDMLPYRRGHDAWLAEDLAALDRPGVFATTTGPYPRPTDMP